MNGEAEEAEVAETKENQRCRWQRRTQKPIVLLASCTSILRPRQILHGPLSLSPLLRSLNTADLLSHTFKCSLLLHTFQILFLSTNRSSFLVSPESIVGEIALRSLLGMCKNALWWPACHHPRRYYSQMIHTLGRGREFQNDRELAATVADFVCTSGQSNKLGGKKLLWSCCVVFLPTRLIRISPTVWIVPLCMAIGVIYHQILAQPYF